MQRQLIIPFVLAFVLLASGHAAAQNSSDSSIQRVPLPDAYLLLGDDSEFEPDKKGEMKNVASPQKLDELEKNLLKKISSIYELHIRAVQDQINDDPRAAEKHITDALKSIQTLLDDYPQIRISKRFKELYRTVYTEYREFYGIKKSTKSEQGKVFAVQRELYESDEWKDTRFVMPDNITTPKTEVPLVHNPQVNRHLMFYSMQRPEVMESWLKRSNKYFPMMKEIFRDEGAPTELVHLSMIESGLNPRARSWASAVGMWQFIRATGSMYGLEVNWWMDERRDPEKATRAAARHLRDLYEIWGDWHLAMASYNISPRGLKRAIRAGGGEEDYWSAYPHLPRETQGYVPGFIATTMINRNTAAFGFEADYSAKEYSYEVAEVAPLMPLDKLAGAAGITLEKIKEYNPELLRWATPPGATYPLKLPTGTKSTFLANYEKIPKDKRSRRIVVHSVQSGQTLGHIARKYGTSVRAIFESNENLSSIIHPGQKIMVPLAPGSTGKITIAEPSKQSSPPKTKKRSPQPDKTAKMSYTVKSGDTMGHIAEWYDVQASQIRAWNNSSNTISMGEKMAIYVPSDKQSYYVQVNAFGRTKKLQIEREQRAGKNIFSLYTSTEKQDEDVAVQYKVQENDTLIKIANSFNVSVSDIKKANDLNSSRIYEGQNLKIRTIN